MGVLRKIALVRSFFSPVSFISFGCFNLCDSCESIYLFFSLFIHSTFQPNVILQNFYYYITCSLLSLKIFKEREKEKNLIIYCILHTSLEAIHKRARKLSQSFIIFHAVHVHVTFSICIWEITKTSFHSSRHQSIYIEEAEGKKNSVEVNSIRSGIHLGVNLFDE